MIDKSDIVIAGIKNKHGCSAKYIKIAENKKKAIVDIYDKNADITID